jgi:hypothetical protein
MQVGAIEPVGHGITLAVMEGALERAARRASYSRIVKSVAETGGDRLLVDKSRLAQPTEFDVDFGDWDHDDIAEDLKAVGVAKVAVVDASRDELSGYLVMALRRCGVAVLTASDLEAALAWLKSD